MLRSGHHTSLLTLFFLPQNLEGCCDAFYLQNLEYLCIELEILNCLMNCKNSLLYENYLQALTETFLTERISIHIRASVINFPPLHLV